MRMIALESTTLATAGYDELEQVLQLQFRTGAVYRYRGVPSPIYLALIQAPSKGQHFHQTIRGRFPYILVPTCETGG